MSHSQIKKIFLDQIHFFKRYFSIIFNKNLKKDMNIIERKITIKSKSLEKKS